MTETAEVIDAEVVGQLIERPAQLGALALKGPGEVLEKAAEVATALAKVVTDRKLAVAIKGKQFVMCEGWTTLGAMLGVAIKELETIESESKPGEFISTVEAIRTSDGLVVGKASASCGPDEKDWSGRSRQARRSMAQTRAAGKAMRLLFSWVMNLAGYAVTPWEEIEGELIPPEHANPSHDRSAPQAAPRNDRITKATLDRFFGRYKAYVNEYAEAHDFVAWLTEVTGRRGIDFTKASQWSPEMAAVVDAALKKAGPPE